MGSNQSEPLCLQSYKHHITRIVKCNYSFPGPYAVTNYIYAHKQQQKQRKKARNISQNNLILLRCELRCSVTRALRM